MTSSPRAELLGKFVPTSIERTPPMILNTSLLKVAFLGIISAGVLPLLKLRTRVEQMISLQQQQLELAGELVACHVDPETAKPVQEAAANAKPGGILPILVTLTMLGSIAVALGHVVSHDWSRDAIREIYLPGRPFSGGISTNVQIFLGLMAVSYLFLLIQINSHIAQLSRFVESMNKPGLAGEKIEIPKLAFGFRPVPILLAAVLLFIGMQWAFLMMLAWGALQSFVDSSDRKFRTQLSQKLQTISGVKPVIVRAGLCPHPGCDQALPDDAHFCPRCGRTVEVG